MALPSPSLKTTKMLWGRAASRCSICKKELVIDPSGTDDESVIGQMCHIVAEADDGPRGDPDYPKEARNKYPNLILLCPNHHKQIDDQVSTFDVPTLLDIKASHEQWVREQLTTFDAAKQRDDEWYAATLDEWERRAEVKNWDAWTSWILDARPRMLVELDEQLFELRRWLLSRIWPGRYPQLENAFRNFLAVLNAFQVEFRKHADKRRETSRELMTQPFYKMGGWDPELYQSRLKEFEEHIDLVHSLTEELTRAANLIIERAREFIFPTYRDADGFLLITYGFDEAFTFHTVLQRYPPEIAAEEIPFPGYEAFAAEVQLKRMSDHD